MSRVAATRELLAPREDVWEFLAEPHHLSDWWPGVHGVRPDRRGLAPGARWEVTLRPQGRGFLGSFLGGPNTTRMLMILEVRTNELVRFMFTEDHMEAELVLEPSGGRPDAGDADGRRRLASPQRIAAALGAQPASRAVPDCG